MITRMAFTLVMFLAGARAGADIINPMEDECRGKAPGAACSVGTCVASTCGRNNYSAGAPPRSVRVPCLVCTPGTTTALSPPPTTSAAARTSESPTTSASPAVPLIGIVAGLAVVAAGVLLAWRWHRPTAR